MKASRGGEVARFRSLVEERLGLAFDDGKLPVLTEVLEQRVRSRRCGSAEQYLRRYLERSTLDGERDELAELLTVGETFFFRDQDQFRALKELIVPDLLARRSAARAIRVLSAGCASGEEPYSIAIALRESVPDLAGWDVRICGIDINPAAIRRATSGRYSAWSFRDTPAEVRQRYFRPDGPGRHRLDEAIRRMVAFEQRHLCEDDPGFWQPGSFDLVFCRNVLMYLSRHAAQAAVARIAHALAPGGFLFLGTAENLRGLSQSFHLRSARSAFYYQVRAGTAPAPASEALPAGPRDGGTSPPAMPAAPEPSDSWMLLIQESSRRIGELARDRGTAPGPEAAPEGRHRSPRGTPTSSGGREGPDGGAPELPAAAPRGEASEVDALLLRATLLTDRGQPQEAEALCQEVLARDHLNAGAHYLLALCCEHGGRGDAAANHDRYALYLDPSFAMPRLHLGLMARRAGDRDVASRELQQALRLLAKEDLSRIALLGGGFTREGLVALCSAELRACGGGA